MTVSRRSLLGAASAPQAGKPRRFAPTWDSLAAGNVVPEWFRDVKFGIWSHWGPQGVGEAGDWYARKMYVQGDPWYDRHLKDYGHPTRHGFIDMIPGWTADKWEPAKLLDLYERAGARFFMALGGHHDNFDCYASKHHAWNSTRVGPKKDIVGIWAKHVRRRGLKFGVSNHVSHAWHWFQTAYGYDPEGPYKGQRYDAYRLTKADGKGRYWDGLDPQELYTGRNMVMPDGIDTIAAAKAWHQHNDRVWQENPPAMNPAFVENWKKRTIDMIDSYRPDILYYDNGPTLPLGQAGLDVTAHYYNRSLQWHQGRFEVVATAKNIPDPWSKAVVADVERGFRTEISETPWMTDTCLGDWFYDRNIFLEHRYKTAGYIIQRVVDAVSKNGTFLLSVPQRADGTIDEAEHAILTEIGDWMAVNGEAIFESRPYLVFGEGPTKLEKGLFGEGKVQPFTARDIRFTTKGPVLYATLLGVPEDRTARITTVSDRRVRRVELLGESGALDFRYDGEAIVVSLPTHPRGRNALTLKLLS